MPRGLDGSSYGNRLWDETTTADLAARLAGGEHFLGVLAVERLYDRGMVAVPVGRIALDRARRIPPVAN